ncbi:hypothetical protein OKA04_12275 [Luteolibacter flavescens]|uniref:Uncharacterized protein n=1 Tax=Luteolibacter flavescens TaxID=1859460 RepID=A0ABT3FPK2_9BACT|nr:hypothetical protein [Luteolibacter flavescens]MCW1885507.1 hypothetical protein [Luteolibacter flavescens]
MNLPQIVTAADLIRFAAPNETHAVRLVIRQINNPGIYTLRGLSRRYLATRDNEIGAHVIDVPVSVWMAGVPKGVYAKNTSIAQDVLGTRNALKTPLMILVVPWKHAQPPAQTSGTPSSLETFKRLAELTGAPEIIMSAISLLSSGASTDEIEATLKGQIAAIEGELSNQPATTQRGPEADAASKPAAKAAMSNAERQKQYRDRKKLEKAKAAKPASKKAKSKA